MQSLFFRGSYRSLLVLRCHLAPMSSTASICSPLNVYQRPSATSTVSVRLLRTRGGHPEQQEKSEGEKSEEAPNEEKKEGDPKKPVDPAIARKLRIYVLVVGGLSFVTSFLLLSRIFKEGSGLPEGANYEHLTRPGIEFNVFVQKYLKAGEVRNIVFCPQAFKAVAYLHEGAVIDGQKARENFVAISYTGNAQQFWADVRKEESLIGISLSNGVPISMYQGMTTWKAVELMIGVLIIAFLGTQYGRLLRQRVLANKSKSSGSSSPPPPSKE